MSVSLPRITVVIPAFNARAWIGETLASVAAQTFPKDLLEIVVVDDASADGTAAEARSELGESGIAHSVLQNPTPIGPGAARNRGWRHGRGEWIQFLDADDLLAPEKLETQAAATSAVATNVAAVFSPWGRLLNDNGQWLPDATVADPIVGGDPVLDVLKTENFLQLGCLLFSRSWLERVGGFEEPFRLIEDVNLMLRLLIDGGSLERVESSRPLSWYRQHPGSLSRRKPTAFIDGCLRNARLAERHWREHGALTEARVALLSDIYFVAARHYAGRNREVFSGLVRDLYGLNPHFVPKAPGTLRLLTRLVGYPQAERCAVRYRRLKQSIRGGRVAVSEAVD